MNYEDALIENVRHALDMAEESRTRGDWETYSFWTARALDLDLEMSRIEEEALAARLG